MVEAPSPEEGPEEGMVSDVVVLPELGAKVKRWLEEEGFGVHVYGDDSVAFFLGIRSPSGIMLHAFQPKEKSDMVLVGASADLSDEDASRLEGLEEKARSRFLWDLRIALLQGSFAFNLSPSVERLRKVLVTEALWGEAITKNALLRSVQHATNGVFLVIGMFAREFDYPH